MLSAPSSLLSARTPYQVVSRVLLHLQPCHSSYSCFSSHAPKLVPTKISRTRHGASKFRDRPVPLVAPSACHQPNRLVKPTPTATLLVPSASLRRGLPRALGLFKESSGPWLHTREHHRRPRPLSLPRHRCRISRSLALCSPRGSPTGAIPKLNLAACPVAASALASRRQSAIRRCQAFPTHMIPSSG